MRTPNVTACAVSASFMLLAAVTLATEPRPAPTVVAPESGDTADVPRASGGIRAPSERERLLAERVGAGAIGGEFVTLGTGDAMFLARYERAGQALPDGVLVVAPPFGSFVGRDPLVDAYTREFPPNGWSVLAVQMPLLPHTAGMHDYQALAEDAALRMREALAFAAASGSGRAILAGEGAGVQAALTCLHRGQAPGVVALATVGSWPGPVGEVHVPVLEVLGAEDAKAIERAGGRARVAAREPVASYEQIALPGADGRMAGHEAAVARRLRGWIDRISKAGGLQARMTGAGS